MSDLKKEDVIKLFGTATCPFLSVAFGRDPMAPDHQELLQKYDLERMSLAVAVQSGAMNLLDEDVDHDADCLVIGLTDDGLSFFLPLQIYYFLEIIERNLDFEEFFFAPALDGALKLGFKLREIFNTAQLEFIVDFFLLFEKYYADHTFHRRIPDYFLQLMKERTV